MSTIKYLNESGEWVDYVEKKSGILVYNGEKWVDGSENELSPSIAVSFYDGSKWIQKYPSAKITYQHTLKGSNMKYIHAKSSTWGNGEARGGTWSSGTVYTGFLGITKPASIAGGRVDTVLSVDCRYTRRGVGYWENPLKLQLVASTLTKASGNGANAHNSKRGSTIYSDTGMAVCTATGQQVKGTTTFNNDNAKTVFKNLLNGSYNSILLGQKESSGDYISLTDIEITITYTANVSIATFSVEDTPALKNKYKRKKLHSMYIFDDELDMTYDEIIEHRAKNNIKDVKVEDITFA